MAIQINNLIISPETFDFIRIEPYVPFMPEHNDFLQRQDWFYAPKVMLREKATGQKYIMPISRLGTTFNDFMWALRPLNAVIE